jgi:hypothetical protein
MRKSSRLWCFTIILFCFFSGKLIAQQTSSSSDAEELAKKLANPVASIISVPVQSNTDFGIGTNNGSRITVNVQPVIPFSISPKLNLITRWILPLVSQQDITGASSQQSGISDALISAFISPTNSKLTWGVGPVLVVPTASNNFLGGKKWAVGPSIVALTQKNGWTYGALANHVVSIGGDKNRSDINATFINPFLTYNWKSGAGLSAVFEYTHDWENEIDAFVFIPTASGVTKFGKQTVSLAIGPRFHFAPSTRPDLGIRAGIALIFPK